MGDKQFPDMDSGAMDGTRPLPLYSPGCSLDGTVVLGPCNHMNKPGSRFVLLLPFFQ